MSPDEAWRAVLDAQDQLVELGTRLVETQEQQQALRAGGIRGFWATLTGPSGEQIDDEVAGLELLVSEAEADMRAREEAYERSLEATMPEGAEQARNLRAVEHGFDVLKGFEQHRLPLEHLAHAFDRIRRWCTALDRVDELDEAIGAILRSRRPTLEIQVEGDHIQEERAAARRDLPFLRVEGTLLSLRHQLEST